MYIPGAFRHACMQAGIPPNCIAWKWCGAVSPDVHISDLALVSFRLGSEWRDHFWFCNCTCTLSVPIINDYLLCIIFTRYSRVNSGHYWDLISHQHVKSQGSTEKLTDSNVGRKFVPQMKKKRDFSACFSASLLYAILLFNQESQSHKIRSHIPIKSDRTYPPM